MPLEFCSDHSAILATLNRLEDGQSSFAEQQSKMYASVAVMESTLLSLHETKALNCAARIDSLEESSEMCKELRAGPRIEAVEKKQDKFVMGTVGAVLLAIAGTVAKAVWK